MISCEPIYTGGGIYCFRGQLSDNEWFIADDVMFDVRIVDAAPWSVDEHGDELCWFDNWQKEHLISDLTIKESLIFFRDMIYWIRENKPKGNYSMSDLDDDLIEITALEKEVLLHDKT